MIDQRQRALEAQILDELHQTSWADWMSSLLEHRSTEDQLLQTIQRIHRLFKDAADLKLFVWYLGD